MSLPSYTLIATAAFGLEAVVARELTDLGYTDLRIENGKVYFQGAAADIVHTNLWLRTADRVLIQVAEFEALSFDELFDQTLEIPWEKWFPADARMHVNGRSHKSQLFSISDCQAIVKKAVIRAMQRRYRQEMFPETGPLFRIEIAMLNDIATLTLDTSGAGLHKRGYRTEAGEAPLKETLAAAMVLLSRWEPSRVLADPLCGSGTIAIEAALIGKNMAPGLNRSFASEEWEWIPTQLWKKARQSARSKINGAEFRILASDSDYHVLKKAQQNAVNAGVADYVAFQKTPFKEFRSRKKYGCIICNPPYGERLSEQKAVSQLIAEMREVFAELETWSFFMLIPTRELEARLNRTANKKRKLFNGNIECTYYQFFGLLPEKDQRRNRLFQANQESIT